MKDFYFIDVINWIEIRLFYLKIELELVWILLNDLFVKVICVCLKYLGII